jgi:hypothetical protein
MFFQEDERKILGINLQRIGNALEGGGGGTGEGSWHNYMPICKAQLQLCTAFYSYNKWIAEREANVMFYKCCYFSL